MEEKKTEVKNMRGKGGDVLPLKYRQQKQITIPKAMYEDIKRLIYSGYYKSWQDFYLTAIRNEMSKNRQWLKDLINHQERLRMASKIIEELPESDNEPIVLERERIIEKEKAEVEITDEEVEKAKELERRILRGEEDESN